MTNEQELLEKYINKNFVPGSVRIDLVNDKIVKLTDKLGNEMKLTINSHGDILDADTNQIYASGGYRHRKSEYFLWEIF